MADIIDSRNLDQANAMEGFNEVVQSVNKDCKNYLISPLTITLGDEFQGVVGKEIHIADILFMLEEHSIRLNAEFKLRYVLYEGRIDTPINGKIAYGMMGDGLTQAREKLSSMKRTANRFNFFLNDKRKSDVLNDAFLVYQGIVDSWNTYKDYGLIPAFLNSPDYKEVARELEKDRSLMWRRMKSLRIDEYLSMKKVISYLIAQKG